MTAASLASPQADFTPTLSKVPASYETHSARPGAVNADEDDDHEEGPVAAAGVPGALPVDAVDTFDVAQLPA